MLCQALLYFVHIKVISTRVMPRQPSTSCFLFFASVLVFFCLHFGFFCLRVGFFCLRFSQNLQKYFKICGTLGPLGPFGPLDFWTCGPLDLSLDLWTFGFLRLRASASLLGPAFFCLFVFLPSLIFFVSILAVFCQILTRFLPDSRQILARFSPD